MDINVVLVDDHAVVREGVKAMFAKTGRIKVVAEADNGSDGVRKTLQYAPEVVVMDINMPLMNGIDAAEAIVSRNDGTRILFLATSQARSSVIAALRAGASGYVAKESCADELISAVQAVAAGENYFCARSSETLLSNLAKPASRDRQLSARELEVLRNMGEGKNTKEIAYTLGICSKTVETHRLHIMKKLDLYNLADLTKYAVRQGLCSLW